MASTVKDIDRGWRKILRQIKRTPPEHVVIVGIQGSEASEDHEGVTNAQLGVIHEFGAPARGIPERSFLRSTIDREQRKINKLLKGAASRLSIGQGLKASLGIVGEFAVAAIRKTFDRSIGLVPLKAATIERKGSSSPLIDEGQLKGSITYKVVS